MERDDGEFLGASTSSSLAFDLVHDPPSSIGQPGPFTCGPPWQPPTPEELEILAEVAGEVFGWVPPVACAWNYADPETRGRGGGFAH